MSAGAGGGSRDGTRDDAVSRRVDDVRRIAVLRANAVGDFVLTLPALKALKTTYADATLTLLGKPWHARFLANRNGPVDEVVCLPPIPGITAPADMALSTAQQRAAADFLDDMRSRGFDIAMQLHGGGRYSNPLVLALDARVSAGFRAPDAAPLARNFAYVPPEIDLHPRALLLRECVGLVGAESGEIEPRLSLCAADVDELERKLPALDGPLVVLQPGATDPRRRWSARRFAAVGDALAALGARVVVNGNTDETLLAVRVCEAMRAPSTNAAGQLSLGGLCALLARAHVVVSNDTGPAHLARALGVPTVTVYWIGNLHSYGPLAVRWHRVAVSYRTECPACGRCNVGTRCEHDVSFVDDVTDEEVIALAVPLYREAAGRPSTAAATPRSR